ncbi:MAG: DsbA family protein [Acidimicrobiales bacterium]
MKVEIWSDVVCPWCYVGKRRFEAALSEFPHAAEVEIHWRSFELDPGAPARREGPYAERLATKYGMTVAQAHKSIDHMVDVGRGEGIDFNFEISQAGNTFDAHRLLHLAGARGHQHDLKDRLLAATFSEGAPIADRGALKDLAVEAGLDADEVEEVLSGDRYAAEVREDEQRAAVLGITAVPFFVFEGQYGLPGAQSPAVLLQALQDVWRLSAPLETPEPKQTPEAQQTPESEEKPGPEERLSAEETPPAAEEPAPSCEGDSCEGDSCVVA